MKTCTVCKVEKPLIEYTTDKSKKEGKKSSCKKCNSIQQSKWVKKDRQKYPEKWKQIYKNKKIRPGYSKQYYKDNRELFLTKVKEPKNRYKMLNSQAKRRGYEVTITLEQFLKLREAPCNYCKGVLNEYGHGLDRIDNSKGYLIDNVVPCCSRCNQIFMQYGKEETFEHMATMLKHRAKK